MMHKNGKLFQGWNIDHDTNQEVEVYLDSDGLLHEEPQFSVNQKASMEMYKKNIEVTLVEAETAATRHKANCYGGLSAQDLLVWAMLPEPREEFNLDVDYSGDGITPRQALGAMADKIVERVEWFKNPSTPEEPVEETPVEEPIEETVEPVEETVEEPVEEPSSDSDKV